MKIKQVKIKHIYSILTGGEEVGESEGTRANKRSSLSRGATDKCEDVGQKGRRARHNQHSLVCEEPVVVVL